MARLHLVLVHLPPGHLAVVLVQELGKALDVVDNVGVGELAGAEALDLLHEAARDHVGEEDVAVDLGRAGLTWVLVGVAGGQIAQGAEGNPDHLLAGGDGDEVGEGPYAEPVAGEVGPDGVRPVELVRHGPEAEGELVELLHGGGGAGVGLLLGALPPPAAAQLAAQVLDPAGRREQQARLGGAGEGRHGGDGQPHRGARGRLELADYPGREGLERLDGAGVGRRPRLDGLPPMVREALCLLGQAETRMRARQRLAPDAA